MLPRKVTGLFEDSAGRALFILAVLASATLSDVW